MYPKGFNPDGPGVTKEDRKAAIANGPKPDCLYLDFAKNVEYHGSVDRAQPRVAGSGQGDAPIKQCPTDKTDINGKCGCDELLHISIMTCTACGYIFPPNEEEKLTRAPSVTPILSTEKPWYPVSSRSFRHHPGKDGKADSVKVTYLVSMKAINEWICCAHTGFPKSKADRWWLAHSGQRPFPRTVLEFLERQHELAGTAEVQLDYARNARYPDVVAHRIGPANDNAPPAANDNRSYAEDWERDEIPF
ncbi:hypothetical protein A4U53_030980 [Rhizobium ruizarguesonis]|uniref:Uncharacterized protein n=1 Tax=Rhizobium ruizarguesonis TaxID=2081791 RepID=A0ACD5EML3_9HYPH